MREHICSSAHLIYHFGHLRTYTLPAADTELSRVFAALTDADIAAAIGVQEWGLSQTTLEQAFIRIVQENTRRQL